MFTVDMLIDSVQNGKKMAVNTFVQHEGYKTVLKDFVDVQTAYTKSAYKASKDVADRLTIESVKAFTDFTKFDITKMFNFAKGSK